MGPAGIEPDYTHATCKRTRGAKLGEITFCARGTVLRAAVLGVFVRHCAARAGRGTDSAVEATADCAANAWALEI